MRAAHYAKNKSHERATNEAWKAANPEKLKQTKARSDARWRENNRDRLRAYFRSPEVKARATARSMERYHSCKEARIKSLLRASLWQALKLQGIKKNHSITSLVGCTLAELKTHLLSQLPEGATLGRDFHVDHKRPCASFDLSDPEQQKQCFHFTNLQVLPAKDNLLKSSIWEGVRYWRYRKSASKNTQESAYDGEVIQSRSLRKGPKAVMPNN
jgi:hypothetical protein